MAEIDNRQCTFCGKHLDKKYQKIYCSKKCERDHKTKISESKRLRICQMCGKQFVMRHPGGGQTKEQTGKYCSNTCRYKSREKQPESCLILYRNCLFCGKTFVSKHAKRYCSDECSVMGRRSKERVRKRSEWSAREPFKCAECGVIHYPEYGDKRKRFCSDKCEDKNTARLRRPRKKARELNVFYEPVDPIKVFERDGWRCKLCGKKLKRKDRGTFKDNAPELDHIITWAEGGEHSYRNTQCACRKCNQNKSSSSMGQLRMFG